MRLVIASVIDKKSGSELKKLMAKLDQVIGGDTAREVKLGDLDAPFDAIPIGKG